MITLKLPTHKIRIALGETANTQLGCYAGFKEYGSGVSNQDDLSLILTQSTTPVDFVPPPSALNLQRNIHTIQIYNRDNISHAVILYYNVNDVDYPLWSGSVPSHGRLEYEDKKGFSVSSPNPFGYCINVQALTSSPADTTPFYFGILPKALVTTANISKVYIRKAGTLKVAEIYTYAGTAGSAENLSLYVRVNNTTDYLIQTIGVSANERVFSNQNLNIPLSVGDYVEIKGIPPVWATNPLTFIAGGYLYIE